MIFTTTTGAGRLVACWGAPAVFMATTINAAAAARVALAQACDVAVIPAGLTGNPDFDAQEDRAAAAAVMMAAQALDPDIVPGEGAADFAHWRKRIETEGLHALFASALHAENLRKIGFEADIPFCARLDVTDAVPMGIARDAFGVLLRPAQTR